MKRVGLFFLKRTKSCVEMDLTGFLFGNVNEEGELEDESVLDKVSDQMGSLVAVH